LYRGRELRELRNASELEYLAKSICLVRAAVTGNKASLRSILSVIATSSSDGEFKKLLKSAGLMLRVLGQAGQMAALMTTLAAAHSGRGWDE
jgi:hypothetical protein